MRFRADKTWDGTRATPLRVHRTRERTSPLVQGPVVSATSSPVEGWVRSFAKSVPFIPRTHSGCDPCSGAGATWYGDTWEYTRPVAASNTAGYWAQVGNCGGPGQSGCGSTAPSPRSGAAMYLWAVTSTSENVLLFGGQTGSSTYNGETWEFVDITSTWTQLSPTNSHSARAGAMMASTATGGSGSLVLFGGYSTSGYDSDTWTWAAGGNWGQAAPTTSPSARAWGGFTYDGFDSYNVLFGGVGSSGQDGDTWEWTGSNWISLSPSTSPSARSAFGMDEANLAFTSNQYVMLIGGYDRSKDLPDLWQFYNGDWTEACASCIPAREYFGASSDSAGGGTAGMFIGGDLTGTQFMDAWFVSLGYAGGGGGITSYQGYGPAMPDTGY